MKENKSKTFSELVEELYPVQHLKNNPYLIAECIGYCKAILSVSPYNKDIIRKIDDLLCMMIEFIL